MKNFRRISGQFYAGSAPNAEDLEYLKNILGIKTVISLDQTMGDQIAPYLKQNKIKQYIIPINSQSNYFDDKLKYLINNLVRIVDGGQPAYIHCLHGQDRTGLAEAIYHIKKQGWSFEQALSAIKKFNFGAGVSGSTRELWTNLLKLLANSPKDKNVADDINMSDDQIMDELRDSFRIYPEDPMQYWQTGNLGPIGSQPLSGSYLSPRQQKLNEIREKNQEINKIPEVGVPKGLGPMRGLGPVENSGVFELQ